MEKDLRPKIRFRGFNESWETTELNSAVTLGSGRDYKHLGDGNIPVYGTGGYMLSVDSALSYDKDAIGIGRKGTIDNPFILKAPFWTVDTLFYATPKDSFDLYFLHCIFQMINWKAYDESTGVPSLSKTTIYSIRINESPNINEQIKVGNLFVNIDESISSMHAELLKLKNVKMACIERMFPREGETIPQLRFNGFTDEWKSYSLETIGEPISTSTLGYADLSETGKYPCILYGELYTKYGETIDNITSRTDIDATILKKNDILFPTSTTVDAISLIAPSCMNEDFAVAGGDMFIIRPKANIDGIFVSYAINNVDYIKSALAKKAQGLTIVHLHYNNIKDVKVLLPTIDEQRKISAYFRHLDELIAAKRQEIEKLQNIKQSLLDKMFV